MKYKEKSNYTSIIERFLAVKNIILIYHNEWECQFVFKWKVLVMEKQIFWINNL